MTDRRRCIDLNIASLVCGFLGNLFLLFNFTRRVRYIVALPATIILFYVASGILIGITAAMHIYVPPGPGEIYSQGFWHAVLAACLYLFNSMILMINMGGYFLGHYPQHFTLTDEQRNLILQTMMFFLWLAGGAAVFTKTEGWIYPDALYFCDVTILTIGFGDFYAHDNLGRGLVFPYSVGGTIILGLMVSSIHRFAGELSKDKVVRKHLEKSRVNTLSRATTVTDEEKKLERLQRLDWRAGHRPSISSPLPSPENRVISEEEEEQEEQNEQENGDEDDNTRRVDFQEPVLEDQPSDPSPHQFLSSTIYRKGLYGTLRVIVSPVKTFRRVTTRSQKAILMREEKDRFDAMRKIQQDAITFKKWYALCLSVTAFAILWCLGAVVFWKAEAKTQQLTYFEALYFCYVSLLTIGYGDFSPKSNIGKPFFIVWSLIAVPTMTILISDMGDTVIAGFKQGTFKVADFTVLPKHGLWRDIMVSNPWLWNFLKRRAEKKKMKKGLPVGPPPDVDSLPRQTIEQLASERLNEHQLTRKLAFAIRKTADDLRNHHDKKYSYEEWVEYTRLIRFTKMGIKDLEYDEDQEGVVEWDWLDDNSPMLSEQTEAEWILDRLCESLLRLLRKNNLGVEPELKKATHDGFRHFSFDSSSQQGNPDEDSEDPRSGALDDETSGQLNEPAAPSTSKSAERRQRALGADAILTFFTGDRTGSTAYATAGPQWSKRAQEKIQQRRRSSQGHTRRGPFAKLVHHHGHRTGAVGGGRGGAGTRTLKARQLVSSVVDLRNQVRG